MGNRNPARPRLARALWALLLVLLFHGSSSAAYERLFVTGESANNGIFDPSIEVDPLSGDAWLAYSAVSGTASPWGPNVETHLAKSSDRGETWRFQAITNASEPGLVTLAGEQETGFWNHEVPSLVYDPTAVGSEWKLFSHKIFRLATDDFVDEQNVPALSWIEMRQAASPTGPWTLVVKLGAGPFPPQPLYPIDQALNDLDDSLADAVVYSEPGAFAAGGLLYLSITALPASGIGQQILISSADGGTSWDWVGPLLDPADAATLGFLDFDGSAIVEQNGRRFLLVSPGTATIRRDGVAIFEFADLAAGLLVAATMTPTLVGRVELAPSLSAISFGGQAAFHEDAAAGGIVMNQLDLAALPELFQIVKSEATPVPEARPVLSLGIGTAVLVLSGRIFRRSARDPPQPRSVGVHAQESQEASDQLRAPRRLEMVRRLLRVRSLGKRDRVARAADQERVSERLLAKVGNRLIARILRKLQE